MACQQQFLKAGAQLSAQLPSGVNPAAKTGRATVRRAPVRADANRKVSVRNAGLLVADRVQQRMWGLDDAKIYAEEPGLDPDRAGGAGKTPLGRVDQRRKVAEPASSAVSTP